MEFVWFAQILLWYSKYTDGKVQSVLIFKFSQNKQKSIFKQIVKVIAIDEID